MRWLEELPEVHRLVRRSVRPGRRPRDAPATRGTASIRRVGSGRQPSGTGRGDPAASDERGSAGRPADRRNRFPDARRGRDPSSVRSLNDETERSDARPALEQVSVVVGYKFRRLKPATAAASTTARYATAQRRTGQPCTYAPPNGPSCSRKPVSPDAF